MVSIIEILIYNLILPIVLTILVNKLGFFKTNSDNQENINTNSKGKKFLIAGIWVYSILSIVGRFIYIGPIRSLSFIGTILAIVGIVLIIKSKPKSASNVDSTIEDKEENYEFLNGERILIKSKQYNVKGLFKALVIIGVVISVFASFITISDEMSSYNWRFDDELETYQEHQAEGSCGRYYDYGELCSDCEEIRDNPSAFGYALSEYFDWYFWFCMIPVGALTLIGGLIYLWLRSYELTVTDKRIFGKVAWGKRVDLPVDSVSATATISLLKGVSVSTSSGRISFLVIKNADAIYKIMNNLLIERQQEKVNATVVASAPKTDEADQIKKYKDLLESCVITQEEFDAKKKKLLGL